jgi:hypothetical protein
MCVARLAPPARFCRILVARKICALGSPPNALVFDKAAIVIDGTAIVS